MLVKLMESIQRVTALRDSCEYGSENWEFYERDRLRLEERAFEYEEDSRYSYAYER